MEERIPFAGRTKLFLVVFSACAFLSIFAAFDTSEHYRAWRTARRWTQEQKETAKAMDAERMYAFTVLTLGLDTLVIAMSFSGALCLGIAVATDSAHAYGAAKILAGVCLVSGILYSALFLWYRSLVGSRLILKGPIFDYDLRLQIPVLLAVLGFPCLAAFFFLKVRAERTGRRGRK